MADTMTAPVSARVPILPPVEVLAPKITETLAIEICRVVAGENPTAIGDSGVVSVLVTVLEAKSTTSILFFENDVLGPGIPTYNF